jgi:hypothetical protein
VVAQHLVGVVARALELEQDAKRELARLVAFAEVARPPRAVS